MRLLPLTAFVAAAALLAAPASADVRVTLHDGRVSVSARDATVRQILEEWARVGQTRIVNAERIGGGPITIELADMPEAQALDVLLRSVSGYVAAPRANVATTASRFDRIIVMPASTPPSGVASVQPTRPPTPPFFNQPGAPMPPQVVPGADTEDENVPGPRGPVFSAFPQPQIGGQPQVGAPQGPLALPPAGAPSGAAYPGAPTGAPAGVSVPGMVVPAPPQPGQAPGAPTQPLQPPRR